MGCLYYARLVQSFLFGLDPLGLLVLKLGYNSVLLKFSNIYKNSHNKNVLDLLWQITTIERALLKHPLKPPGSESTEVRITISK